MVITLQVAVLVLAAISASRCEISDGRQRSDLSKNGTSGINPGSGAADGMSNQEGNEKTSNQKKPFTNTDTEIYSYKYRLQPKLENNIMDDPKTAPASNPQEYYSSQNVFEDENIVFGGYSQFDETSNPTISKENGKYKSPYSFGNENFANGYSQFETTPRKPISKENEKYSPLYSFGNEYFSPVPYSEYGNTNHRPFYTEDEKYSSGNEYFDPNRYSQNGVANPQLMYKQNEKYTPPYSYAGEYAAPSSYSQYVTTNSQPTYKENGKYNPQYSPDFYSNVCPNYKTLNDQSIYKEGGKEMGNVVPRKYPEFEPPNTMPAYKEIDKYSSTNNLGQFAPNPYSKFGVAPNQPISKENDKYGPNEYREFKGLSNQPIYRDEGIYNSQMGFGKKDIAFSGYPEYKWQPTVKENGKYSPQMGSSTGNFVPNGYSQYEPSSKQSLKLPSGYPQYEPAYKENGKYNPQKGFGDYPEFQSSAKQSSGYPQYDPAGKPPLYKENGKFNPQKEFGTENAAFGKYPEFQIPVKQPNYKDNGIYNPQKGFGNEKFAYDDYPALKNPVKQPIYKENGQYTYQYPRGEINDNSAYRADDRYNQQNYYGMDSGGYNAWDGNYRNERLSGKEVKPEYNIYYDNFKKGGSGYTSPGGDSRYGYTKRRSYGGM